MSTPPKSHGRRGDGKAALPKRFSLPKEGLPLGHCKICNVLSLMWSAIGNLQHKFSMPIRPCLCMVFFDVSRWIETALSSSHYYFYSKFLKGEGL